jgi:choline dehydrogenase-like flavoprotein
MDIPSKLWHGPAEPNQAPTDIPMTIETDTCIVGAGPAGLAVAHALASAGVEVILLDSGADVPQQDLSALNDGDVVGGPYAPLGQSRSRQIGGSSGLWNTPVCRDVGAKYVPLDAADFERREGNDGWPIDRGALLPYYERAQRVCGIGPFAYDADDWADDAAKPLAMDSSCITSRIYQLGTRTALVSPLVSAIERAPNARVITNATVLRLDSDSREDAISSALVASPAGDRWTLRANRFVLAAGAIENARLLLISGRGDGIGNEFGMVGRCFMEHPRDHSLTLIPSTAALYRDASFYDARLAPPPATAADGQPHRRSRFEILGRLALRDDLIRQERMLNASATLLPIVRPWLRRTRSWLRGSIPRLGPWLPSDGHGWSRHPSPRRVFDGFQVLLNVEQRPSPNNRVVLGARRDPLGVQLPELHWELTTGERKEIERLRELFARELERAGLGRVVIRHDATVDPNAHHHAGTTRMHEDPRHGVVDANARVHSVSNLFVAGASVFPTAGFANPVLTTIALSLRLADHLAKDS